MINGKHIIIFFLLTITIIFNKHVFAYVFSHTKLTVVTFNLANYDDHPRWLERINLIVDAIEKADADVVVLQEVRFNPDELSTQTDYENMAEQILRTLNSHGKFLDATLVTQPIMFYPNNVNFPLPKILSTNNKTQLWEGLSIISKYKIVETGTYFLSMAPDCHDGNKRGTQYAKIMIADKSIYIANIHFGLANACLESNLRETLDYLQQQNANAEMLVLGDFNATPDNVILQKLAKAGFVDVWQKLHPNLSGYTFPSDQPVKRIDYVWANALVASQLNDPTQIWLTGTEQKNGIYPSDHLGLAVTW